MFSVRATWVMSRSHNFKSTVAFDDSRNIFVVWENETSQFYRLESGGGLCVALIFLIETVPTSPL